MARKAALKETEDEAVADQVDETGEADDNEEVGEADDAFIVRVAKDLGWRDEENWDREADRRLSARQYLEQTPTKVKTLQEQRDRANSAAAQAIEEDRRQRREELETRVRQAEDPDERVKIARELGEVSGPPPQTQAWIAKNPWFQTDPAAQREAHRVVNFLAAQGMTIEDQLDGAEAAVRTKFPHHFPEAQPREVRLSETKQEVRRPVAQQGSRASVGVSKEKGFADLPYRIRQDFEKNLGKYLKTDAQKDKYAKAYWADQAARDAGQ